MSTSARTAWVGRPPVPADDQASSVTEASSGERLGRVLMNIASPLSWHETGCQPPPSRGRGHYLRGLGDRGSVRQVRTRGNTVEGVQGIPTLSTPVILSAKNSTRYITARLRTTPAGWSGP